MAGRLLVAVRSARLRCGGETVQLEKFFGIGCVGWIVVIPILTMLGMLLAGAYEVGGTLLLLSVAAGLLLVALALLRSGRTGGYTGYVELLSLWTLFLTMVYLGDGQGLPLWKTFLLTLPVSVLWAIATVWSQRGSRRQSSNGE